MRKNEKLFSSISTIVILFPHTPVFLFAKVTRQLGSALLLWRAPLRSRSAFGVKTETGEGGTPGGFSPARAPPPPAREPGSILADTGLRAVFVSHSHTVLTASHMYTARPSTVDTPPNRQIQVQ